MIEFASLVLFAVDVEETARFYRAVGIALEDEDHGEGPVHFAAALGDVHFAIYPASTAGTAPLREDGRQQLPGLYVEPLDEARQALNAVGQPSSASTSRCHGDVASWCKTQTIARWR